MNVTPVDIPEGWFERRGSVDVTYDQKLLAETGILVPVLASNGMALGKTTDVQLHSSVNAMSTLVVTFFIEPPYIEKPDEDIT